MCYSAQIEADYRKFRRVYGAVLSLEDFVKLYWWRQSQQDRHLLHSSSQPPGSGWRGQAARVYPDNEPKCDASETR